MLTFRDKGKKLELKGDLLKVITNKNNNVDLASLSDTKILYDFAEKKYFDVKALGNISTKDRNIIRLLKLPSVMVSSSGISNTNSLPSDPNELCNWLNLLLLEKQARNKSNINNEEIVVIVDKLLEYKCISKKQQKQILDKSNPLHTKKTEV